MIPSDVQQHAFSDLEKVSYRFCLDIPFVVLKHSVADDGEISYHFSLETPTMLQHAFTDLRKSYKYYRNKN